LKTLWTLLAAGLAAASFALVPDFADAKRLGGGRAAGMQRAVPAQPVAPKPAAPPQQAAPATPQPTNPAPGKRSWLGPVAGLAAGLGLAALFSHLGLGEELASMVMLGLLALAAMIAVRWVARRMTAPRPGLAAAGGAPAERIEPIAASGAMSPLPAAGSPHEPMALPGGMAAADFERLAKLVFVRLQAANDAGDVDDLRKFTTPELFASLRLDLQERGGVAQKTDVVQIDAQVVDVAEENGQSVVSVRFSGLIRESADAGAEPFAEVWHLVRSASGQGDWAIAGITPVH
jgi:predicted lipid-binding transport protein (Tim44 family)